MEMKRKVLDFVKTSYARKESAALGNVAVGDRAPALPEVKMTERGYPILPHEASSPAHVNKKQLEHMMRAFLSQHYCEFLMDNYR